MISFIRDPGLQDKVVAEPYFEFVFAVVNIAAAS